MDFDRDAVLTSFIAETQEGLDLMEQSLLAMESSSGGAELLDDIFRVAHTLKGNATSLELDDLKGFAHATEDLLDVLREQNTEIGADVISLLLKTVDELRALVAKAATTENPRLTPEQQKLRKQIADEVTARSQRVVAPNPKAERSTPAGAAPLPGAAGRTLRIDIDKLDRMLNLTGEIVIAQGRLRRMIEKAEFRSGREILEMQSETERLFRDLQDEVMKVRMVPIGQVFDRFPRLVRDVAKARGKEVQLVISGAETDLDKTIVDEVGEPLMHLLRNNVDHGIESPEERERMGKPRVGTITLNAYHEGNQIIIEVSDDGGGINLEKVRARGIKQGLISAEDRLTDREIIELIFTPGFSTAEVVSDVSGRGVGMDVVKRNISRLKGVFDVDTAPGQGTRFTIKLPLTLAIIQALLVRVADELYAIPLDSVIESQRVEMADVRTVHGNEVITLRGQVVPLVRIAEFFELGGERDPDKVMIVIVGLQGRQVGLVVDSFEGEQEIVIKPLSDVVGRIAGISGATILGNGSISLIIDVHSLVSEAYQGGKVARAEFSGV